MFWFFGHEECRILAPRQEIKPIPPALESEVLTAGPPGKSHQGILKKYTFPGLWQFVFSFLKDQESLIFSPKDLNGSKEN